jgi:hypothetical protein
MTTTQTGSNIPPEIYAATAFQIVINLLMLLKNRGTLKESDRVDLINMVAAGLNPANDPHIRAMKELLWTISGVKPS